MNLDRVIEISKKFADKKIAVLGDVMVDSYVWGDANRISPEAPVPVVHVKKKTQCLGGASNVMRNVVTLGGNVNAFSVYGDDLTGRELKNLLDEYKIDHSNMVLDHSRSTIEKKRVVASGQQLLRIDYEDTGDVSEDVRDKVMDLLFKQVENNEVDAVIVEDYAKGLLSKRMLEELVDRAKDNDVKVVLDPHPGHPLHVKGLTLMTPNRNEAFGLAGIYCSEPVTPVENDTALMKVAEVLMKTWGPDYLLITLGAQGMALFEKNGDFVVIPTQAREVYDVSGAGDTVISAFSLALISGATGEEAAIFANHAAGVVVGKVGTVSVDIHEVYESFQGEEK